MLNTKSYSLVNRLNFKIIIAALSTLVCFTSTYAQPGTEIEIDKPAKYEKRKLGAEKTPDKKISFPKKIYQNTVTHYNYYFNANQRLNELLVAAKQSYKDDYSQLLPYYNYTLDATSQSKDDLDSVIYKCTAGILLHDLRNGWIDNMYLLLGKAYFFRKDFDSAGLTFQYLNFSYAPKDAGYDKPIGSNASNDVGEFSISTKEKNSIWTKLTSRPPSRNESFIWQARNFIEKDELPEAAGIIEILRHDPNFPKRLHTNLDEILGYWFYKQQVYDSAAFYLSKALPLAVDNQEKSRWEYLIAQMYQLSNKNELAVQFYDKSIEHTSDPVMDVYARLNSIRIKKSDKKDYLQENIDELVHMAKKDKYSGYRDIIYYAAANIELERKNYKNAQDFLLQSVKFTTNNPQQRNQSFLLLADMNYDRKAFTDASHYYDSIEVNSVTRTADKDRITTRKPPLKIIADNYEIVYKQDSLQALAKLSPADRDAVIKKQMKALKKAQGLKFEEAPSFNTATKAPDLFGDQSGKSGDFYFYNSSSKARGFSEFKTKWGERTNVDNWRRKSAVDKQMQRFTDVDDVANTAKTEDIASQVPEDSYEGMQANIPLTQEKLDVSNKSIEDALYLIGKTFINGLEEYPSAIAALEDLLKRFPESDKKDEVLFNLVYACQKNNDIAKANYYKNLLTGMPNSKWVAKLNTATAAKDSIKASPATKKYEDIYTLFIEGRFAEAIAEKKVADSTYGKSFWTPQLLFIESIYYIKQQDDSTAIKVLTDLTLMPPPNQMADRAKTMIDVLKRRKEIEGYLTNLDVSRKEDDVVRSIDRPEPILNTRDTAAVKSAPVSKDSTGIAATKPVVIPAAPTVVVKNFSFDAAVPHYVVVILDKVDPVYQSEARNAFNRYNKEKFYSQKIDITSVNVDERFNLVLQGPFNNAGEAVDYVDKVKPLTKSRILPWLSAEKFSYLIISEANLETLKTNKDMAGYKELIEKALPGKF